MNVQHIQVTINCADGREFECEPRNVPADLTWEEMVQDELTEHGLSIDDWSSLLVVITKGPPVA